MSGLSRMNVGAALLFIVGIVGAIYGVQELFMFVFLDEALLGVTASEIRAFNPNLLESMQLESQLEGLYMLSTALIFCVVSLVPYRRGERWAWYTALGTGSLAILGQLLLVYLGVEKGITASYLLPLAIVIVILWIVGLALPAKEILSKRS